MEQYSFGNLKRMLANDTVNERKDEDPVTLADVPRKLMADLKAMGCELEDSASFGMHQPLPYVYVFVPVRGAHVPKGAIGAAVKKAHWHIIDSEAPNALEPRHTFWISPYSRPHEPGSDEIERVINADRSRQKQREEEYAEEVAERVEVIEDGDEIDFPKVNETLDYIQNHVSLCKKTLQDLYRDQRYGSSDALQKRKQQVKLQLEDIMRAADDLCKMFD